MPITEGIIIPITADASGLQDGINQAKQAVSDFSGATSSAISDSVSQWDILQDRLQRYTDLAQQASNLGLDESFKRATRGIAQTEAQLDNYTRSLKNADAAAISLRGEQQKAVEATKQIISATEGATVSQEANRNVMMAMNRVIKDSHSLLYSSTRGVAELSYALPYLFQRIGEVKEETGSWKLALGSLGGGLMSMTGLMFAAGTAIAFLIRSHKEGKDAAKEHADEIKSTADALNKAESSFTKASAQVEMLRETFVLARKGVIDKKDAVNEYNKELGNALGKVQSLDEAEKNLTAGGEAYIHMTLLKAAANLALEAAAKKAFQAEQDRLKSSTDFQSLGTNAAAFGKGQTMAPGFVPGQDPLAAFKARQAEAEIAKQKTIDAAVKASKELENIGKKLLDDAAKWADDHKINFFDKLIDKKPKKEAEVKPEKFLREYHPKAPLYSTLGDAQNRNAAERLRILIKGIGIEAGNTSAQIKKMSVDEQTELNKAAMKALEWKNLLISIGDVAVNALTKDFEGMFTTLIQGGNNAIGSLIQNIGKLITKLISAALAAAALSALLGIATGGGSTLGSTLGIKGAGDGFGSMFKSIFGGLVGHASGGITNKPHLAMVGEGKEREVITPLSQLKNIIGSVGGSRAMPVPQLYMRGADMWIMWQRQQQQNLRNF
jgi:hypothetical protein